MKAVVVYESIYGNTHLIAEAVGLGLVDLGDVEVVPVGAATPELMAAADLVVVGGPTHVHGMSSAMSRKGAIEDAAKPEKDLELDPDAEGPGLRDWFDDAGTLPAMAAAFDTRMPGSPALTGRASKGIAKRLHRHGCRLVAEPMSFLVSKDNHLAEDEETHARLWGADLAARCAPVAPE